MKGLMVWGTTSDAGKSYIVTGLCRALYNRGINVAPFKGQNMSNNSYVTATGHEIGRSQGLQAEAANVVPTVDMNPVLLKPRSDRKSEVIVRGKSLGSPDAARYRSDFFTIAKQAVADSLQTLSANYDVVLMEGAGSPAEVNLMDKDLANLETAAIADVPALLAGNIERGGVFASITGTLQLLPKHYRDRVQGVIVNKFRGDPALFKSGITWLEQHTGIPVQGVLPAMDIRIEQEDSLSFSTLHTKAETSSALDVAVIAMPYVSNYTDVEPFLAERDVAVRIVREANQFGCPDAVILPGTRSTIHDYHHLAAAGLTEKIIEHYQQGRFLVGICGGFQMLGKQLIDAHGADTGVAGKTAEGMGIFPLYTTFETSKQTNQWQGRFFDESKTMAVSGFEIHSGLAHIDDKGSEWKPLFYSEEKQPEGMMSRDASTIGTYIHHLFHNDSFRHWWLNQLRQSQGKQLQALVPYSANKEKRLNELADALEEHLNIDNLITMMEKR
ncbi:adenosylcobyric acid synthase (glutamine-hydrolysing) [Alteribacillus persepolensis]|uniref:Cobyric acid synthase n=1 Tax=Alteribacillus persepolensis TaxID=568899 RepID=A0A1G7ZKW8_9BACI|nr:cobyric acid synthase [Alteribacillus persepolensis]SDH09255.1 adenosylcobyric acid synthase (glutamine-hydrolysing) [Alteribacillus persepolensis]